MSNDLELNGRRALVTKSDGHLPEIKTGGSCRKGSSAPELATLSPKREPALPHRWYHKIRRMRSGRELMITDIVGNENEQVCERPWRNSLLRSTSAPDSRRPARAASRMD